MPSPFLQFTFEEDLPTEDISLTEKTISRHSDELRRGMGLENRFVSIFFCGEEAIRELNANHRGMDKPTDVLSWEYDNPLPDSGLETESPFGELAICVPIIRKNAEKHRWSYEVELIRLLTHGLVHLAGYDHEISEQEEQRMLKEEIRLLKLVGMDFVYE